MDSRKDFNAPALQRFSALWPEYTASLSGDEKMVTLSCYVRIKRGGVWFLVPYASDWVFDDGKGMDMLMVGAKVSAGVYDLQQLWAMDLRDSGGTRQPVFIDKNQESEKMRIARRVARISSSNGKTIAD